jgi:hypothetical protein
MKTLKSIIAMLFAGFMPKYAISDTDAVHHYKQFHEMVQELAGGQKRAYLKETFSFQQCGGEADFIDGMHPANDAGADNAMSAVTSRYTYDQIGSPTAENLTDNVLTRNDNVQGQRTQILPRQFEIGKWFASSEKNFLEYTDPTSRKIRALWAGYWRKMDLRGMHALFDATMNRVADDATDSTTVTTEAIPASQIMADVSNDTIDHKIFSTIKAKMLTQYLTGEHTFVGFGPNTWKALVDNSGDRLLNQDYVSSAKHFETGDLPMVYGCVPVVHPLFDDTATLTTAGLISGEETGLIAGWTEDGVCWGEFMAEKSLMEGPSGHFKGQSAIHVECFANAVRADDLQVVQGAVVA